MRAVHVAPTRRQPLLPAFADCVPPVVRRLQRGAVDDAETGLGADPNRLVGAFAVPREELVRGKVSEMVVLVLRVVDDAPVDPPALSALALNGCVVDVLIQLAGVLVIRGSRRLELEPALAVVPDRVGEAEDVGSVGKLGELQIRWQLRPQVGVQCLAGGLASSDSGAAPACASLPGALAVAGSRFGPRPFQESGESAKSGPGKHQGAAARRGREGLRHGIELATRHANVPGSQRVRGRSPATVRQRSASVSPHGEE